VLYLYNLIETVLIMNWQVFGQILSIIFVLGSGPAVIVFLAFKKGDL
jgi:hypothetical protein